CGVISSCPVLTFFHVSKNITVRALCSCQRSSSGSDLRSIRLQGMKFEIKNFAGMRFNETAKYRGNLLTSSFNCPNTCDASNLLKSLFTNEREGVTLFSS